MNGACYPILAIVIPLIAAAIALLFTEKTRGWFSFFAGVLTFIFSLLFFISYKDIPSPYVIPWAEELSINFSLFTDGLSAFTVLFASLLGMIVLLYSISYMKKYKSTRWFYPIMLISLGSGIGVLLSANLIFFIIFWEVVTAALFGLLSLGKAEDEEKTNRSAFKTWMILAASGYAMIIGIMLFYMITGSFEIEEVIAGLRGVTGIIVPLSLGLFLIGPIGKAASIPLHTWFPDAAQVAPTPAIGMLPAAIEKLMGIYALTRVCWYMFEIGLSWRLGLAILGAITMVIAVMMALAQNDAKRLVAYGSITQVGYMIMSIALGTSLAVAAGLFHLINCMVYSACLFLAVGAVQYMTGTKDMEKLGGLSKKMPITAAIFVIAALTISGIPPFSAFASKWMIYQAAITADSGFAIFAVVAMIVSALTLAVFIKAIHSIFYGRMPESLEKMEIKEVPKTMTVSMGILAAICIIFGILPQIPLNYFVIPGLESLGFMMDPTVMAYPISTNIGTWASAPATIMLIAALLIGAIIYWISSKGVTTGEPVTTYACGEDPSPDTISVTSDNLYSPIKTTFSGAYNVGMRGGFDIAYNAIARFVVGFSQRFRASQSGMLRTYIGWLVVFLGVMSMVIMMISLGVI